MVSLIAEFLTAYFVLDFSSCLYMLNKHHTALIAR